MSAWKLHTENIGGNLHSAAVMINKLGWAEYLIAMDSGNGMTVCVFRMPSAMVKAIRAVNRSFVGDPSHDDPKDSA